MARAISSVCATHGSAIQTMDNKWRKRGRFWAGTLCAALWSWLAFALTNAVTSWLFERYPAGELVFTAFYLLSFPVIFYCAAIIATYFWSTLVNSVVDNKECEAWATGTVMLIFTPLPFVSAAGLLILIFLFPVARWCFLRAVPAGGYLWKRRLWRQFFGFNNEWEREETER